MVDRQFFGHFFWKVVGSCAHTCESRTATVHGAPYMVNSRVVVGGNICVKGSNFNNLGRHANQQN